MTSEIADTFACEGCRARPEQRHDRRPSALSSLTQSLLCPPVFLFFNVAFMWFIQGWGANARTRGPQSHCTKSGLSVSRKGEVK